MVDFNQTPEVGYWVYLFQSLLLEILHFILSVCREHEGRWLNSPESRKPTGGVGVLGSDPWAELSKARMSWLDSHSPVPAWNSFRVSEHLSSVRVWPDKLCPLKVAWELLGNTFLSRHTNSFWQLFNHKIACQFYFKQTYFAMEKLNGRTYSKCLAEETEH